MSKFKAFLKNEEGLVTIEWIGIAAVMVIAAVAIAAFVMNGADIAGGNVNTGLNNVATNAANATGPTQAEFGDGK